MMNKSRCIILWGLAFFIIFGALPDWGQVQRDGVLVPAKLLITAKISSPGSIVGACPYTIKFKGMINVTGPCKVQYRFIRSDKAIKPIHALQFVKAGSIMVEDTWTIGANTKGWEAIQVTSPVSVISNHGDFSLTCVAKPVISNARLHCGGTPCSEIDVFGTGFGASQGSRKLVVDGMAASSILHWSDTSITMQITGFTLVYWDHVYQISLQEGVNTISNVYSTRFPIRFDGVNPSSGAPGAEIMLPAWGGGSQADGRVVKIGNSVCQIVSWVTTGVNAMITLKVPQLSPGGYKIYIQRGADIISEQLDFTVL